MLRQLACTLAVLAATAAVSAGTTPTNIHAQEFLNRVAAFHAENATLPAGQANVVFAGDSHMLLWELDTSFPDWNTLNRGIGGDGLLDFFWDPDFDWGLLRRMEPTFYATQPELIVIMVGTNHLAEADREIATIIGWYGDLLELLETNLPGVPVIGTTLPPAAADHQIAGMFNLRVPEFNAALRPFFANRGVPYVDLYALLATPEGALDPAYSLDGIHLSPAGYVLWTAELRNKRAQLVTTSVDGSWTLY